MGWRRVVWYGGWLMLLLFSLDYWNWGQTTPLIHGIPFWTVNLLAVTLGLSVFYALFTEHMWGGGR
jgi:hypothetical protein